MHAHAHAHAHLKLFEVEKSHTQIYSIRQSQIT